MCRHARHRLGIPRGRHRAQTGDEGPLVTRDRHRAPAALDEHLRAVLALGSGGNRPTNEPRKSADVAHGWADTVEPRALVGRLWRSEGRAGELLGIKSVGDLRRRVAADRQRARQRLGLEAVAEAGHVFTARHSAVPRQSSEIFADWITSRHFAVSLRIYSAKLAGELVSGSMPAVRNFCCMAGFASAAPICALSLSMIAAGVLAGATMPCHADAS